MELKSDIRTVLDVRSDAMKDERWAFLKRGSNSSFRVEYDGSQPDFSGEVKVIDRVHGRRMDVLAKVPITSEDAFLLVLNEEGWSGYDWLLVHRTGEPIASCEDGYCSQAQALNNAFKRIGEDNL